MIPFDNVFSYWIVVWYLLYELGLVKYNPKFAIILGLIENAIYLFFMILYDTSLKYILLFILINTVIKIIPLLTLWNTTIYISDIYATIILFIIYLAWLIVRGVNITSFLKGLVNSIKTDKPNTPILSLF
jgi:hypothetical protein